MMDKYFRISGRASRAEYWWFYLFANLVIMAASMLSVVAAVLLEMQAANEVVALSMLFFGLIVTLSMVIPSITATVRRLHDTNRSGWWYLISLVPYIGNIVLIVFCCLPSDEGENDYGEAWCEDA